MSRVLGIVNVISRCRVARTPLDRALPPALTLLRVNEHSLYIVHQGSEFTVVRISASICQS